MLDLPPGLWNYTMTLWLCLIHSTPVMSDSHAQNTKTMQNHKGLSLQLQVHAY